MPVPKVGFPEPAIPSMLEEQVQDHSEWEEAEPFSNEKIAAENFRITDEHLGEGGPKAKFQANMEAIRTLKQIENEGRGATAEEQEIMSRYVGWGGLPDLFDPDKTSWVSEYRELKEALTPAE